MMQLFSSILNPTALSSPFLPATAAGTAFPTLPGLPTSILSNITPRPKTPVPSTVGSSVPGSPLKTEPIPLEQFCETYGLDDEIMAGLARLRYTPGDRNVEKLGREDWKEEGKLHTLQWNRVLDAHMQYLKDARNGRWIS